MAGALRWLQPVAKKLFTKLTAPPPVRFYADAAKTGEMPLTFASANRIFYDAIDVKQVDIPGINGVFGVLPNHVPILTVLQPGVVTVYEEGGEKKQIFVSSGMACVNEDSSVQVLAEEAHPVEDLDASAAQDVLKKAEQELSSAPEEKKPEAAIAVEIASAIVKAIS